MNQQERQHIEEAVEIDGFSYAFLSGLNLEDSNDEDLKVLIRKFRMAASNLAEYCGVEHE